MGEKSRADTMHEIEHKHFGRCIDQVWTNGRRNLIELMDYPKANCQVVVVKQFEDRVPTSGSGKQWPDLVGCWVYVPVEDGSNTWTGLDSALTAFETKQESKAA